MFCDQSLRSHWDSRVASPGTAPPLSPAPPCRAPSVRPSLTRTRCDCPAPPARYNPPCNIQFSIYNGRGQSWEWEVTKLSGSGGARSQSHQPGLQVSTVLSAPHRRVWSQRGLLTLQVPEKKKGKWSSFKWKSMRNKRKVPGKRERGLSMGFCIICGWHDTEG